MAVTLFVHSSIPDFYVVKFSCWNIFVGRRPYENFSTRKFFQRKFHITKISRFTVCEGYNETDCTVHDSVCKSSFLWKRCMLAGVQHVKLLHNISGHNTDYACDFVWCFVLCMPSGNCFAWLAEGQVSGIMWPSETVPQDAPQNLFLYLDC